MKKRNKEIQWCMAGIVILIGCFFVWPSGSIDILADRVNEIVIVGKDGVRKTVRQHTVAIKCDQDDQGDSHEFLVLEFVPGKVEPIRRKVLVTCSAPEFQYTHEFTGWVPEYTIDSAYEVFVTPYAQGVANRSRDAVPIYQSDQPPPLGPDSDGPPMLAMPVESSFFVDEELEVEPDGSFSLRTKAPPVKLTAILGSGLGIGVDLGCLPGMSFLGGCGGDGVEQQLIEIGKQLDILTNFAEKTGEWMHTAEQKFAQNEVFQKLTAQQLEYHADSIAALNREIPVLWNFQRETAIYMTESFTKTRNEIMQAYGFIEKLAEASGKMFDKINSQFVDLTRAQQGLGRNVQDILVTLWQTYQDTGLKRAVTKMFFDNKNVPFLPALPSGKVLGPSHKFLGAAKVVESRQGQPVDWDYGGRPPMKNGFKDYKNLDAVKEWGQIAATSVLYTVSVAGRRVAVSDEIRYLCDLEFTLNNNIPGLSMSSIFDRLGPDRPDRPDKSCKSTIFNKPWSCNCVIEWVEQSCPNFHDEFPGDMLYPWDTPTTKSFSLANAKRPNGTPLCTLAPPRTMYFTSQESFSAQMTTSYCSRLTGQPVMLSRKDSAGNQYAFRIMSNELPAFWNLTLPKDIADCQANFSSITQGTGNVAQFIFRAWQSTYQVNARTMIPGLDSMFYGNVPDDLEFTLKPWANDPSTGGTYRSVNTRFTSVSNKKERLYEMNLRAEGAGISVGVTTLAPDGSPIDTHNEPDIPIGIGEIPWLDLPDQNMSTNVVTTVPHMNVLPPFIMRMGPPGVGQDKYVYDTPPDLLTVAQTASARHGKLNYIFERKNTPGVTDTSYMNMQTWKKIFKTAYQPSGATESAIWYRREVTSTLPTECDKSYATGAPTFAEYNWCLILRHFKIQRVQVIAGTEYIFFSPRRWSYIGNLIFPAGTIQTVVSSMCPGVTIRQATGRAIAFFTNPTMQSNRVQVIVRTHGCDQAAKSGPRQCSLCDFSKFIDLPRLVAYPVDIGECPGYQLELNVFTLEYPYPRHPCYGNETSWLDVSSTANRSGDALKPGDIEPFIDHRVRIVEDKVADALARQYNDITDYNIRLNELIAQAKDKSDLYDKIRDLVKNKTIDIERWIIKNYTERIKEIDKIIDKETQRVIDNLERSRNSSIEMQKKIKELEELNKKSKEQLNEIDKIIKDLKEQNKKTQDVINDYVNRHKGECDIGIPIIGSIACFFSNIFRSFLNLFPSNIMGIFQWIIFFLVIFCICFCFCICVSECKKCADDANRIKRLTQEYTGGAAYPDTPRLDIETLEQIRCYMEVNRGRACDERRIKMMEKVAPGQGPADQQPLLAPGRAGRRMAGLQLAHVNDLF